jgi:hypothetical protein
VTTSVVLDNPRVNLRYFAEVTLYVFFGYTSSASATFSVLANEQNLLIAELRRKSKEPAYANDTTTGMHG